LEANVSFTLLAACKFEFEVARAETPASALYSQKGTGPVLNLAGDLDPGTYNLAVRFKPGEPKCNAGTKMVLRYDVTITPR
jgi:hypothetical protein